MEYCTYFQNVGDTLKKVDKGSELPGELTDALDQHQAALEASATLATGETRKDILRAADAQGQLKLAIAAAGTSYTTDRVVEVRLLTAKYTLLSAALVANCSP